MKIKREVLGKEYEFVLTQDELREAFWEQQKENDIEDIEMVFDYDDSKMPSRDIIEEMASVMRNNMELRDMEFSLARDEAIDYVGAIHGLNLDY